MIHQTDLAQRLVHLIGGVVAHWGHLVRAAVQGQLDIGVPREVLDVLEVRTSRKQDREEAMPQIVQAHLR